MRYMLQQMWDTYETPLTPTTLKISIVGQTQIYPSYDLARVQYKLQPNSLYSI